MHIRKAIESQLTLENGDVYINGELYSTEEQFWEDVLTGRVELIRDRNQPPDELHEEAINNIGNDDERNLLLMHIDHEISKLNDENAEGHIWWNKFRVFIIDHFKNEGRELTEEENAAMDYDPNDEINSR